MAHFSAAEHFAKTDWRGRQIEEKKRVGRVVPKGRPMHWVSLHHHSTLSYLDAVGLPAHHAERVGDLQQSAMALTEHGNVSSHVKLEQAAAAVGIKPIYGCEFYQSDNKTQLKNHLTVLAETDQGYKNLLRLVTYTWENFYYKPTLDTYTLAALRQGLVVLSGCSGSQLATSLVGGKLVPEEAANYKRGLRVARRYKQLFGDAYYLEIQAFPELEFIRKLNPMIMRIGRKLKIPVVATYDVHYPDRKDSILQQILHNVRGAHKQSLEDQYLAWGYNVPLCPPDRDRTVWARLQETGLTAAQARQVIMNTEEVGERCSATLPKAPMIRYPLPEGYSTSRDLWRQWIRDGWKYRGCDSLPSKERARYKKQLQYEVGIIESKDFLDYFLVVSDMVRWSKDHGILVGPARGSAAASLVCWLLRITEVNPMLFPDLVFERFIDLTRKDLPDIDLDFPSKYRDRVRQYLVDKYGQDRVGNLGTYTQYKGKNALDDVARAFRVPSWEVQKIKDLLIERSSGDLRASATIMDTVEQFEAAGAVMDTYPNLHYAVDLEGNYRGQGVHAAGLVVANQPLTDLCAVLKREVKDKITEVISPDKYDAEYLGMLKIDALSLNTIDMLNEAVEILGLPVTHYGTLPLDDPKVLKVFTDNDVVGIFQFDGQAMRNVNGSLKADSFKEVCDVNALARPGPLHSGATAEYVDAKWGRRAAQKIHPLFDNITGTTKYQVVYQEQILRIMGEIGGFDHTHRTHIRKIISRKLGEQEFNRQWGMFKDGAAKRGVAEELARWIWDRCTTAGSYAFNAAHCVSYGMLAYWTAWLKAYHPTVFYAMALKYLNPKKQLELCRDAHRHGIMIKPPHAKFSDVSWKPGGRTFVRAGLSQISGVGAKTALTMIDYRAAHKVRAWKDYLPIKGVGPKTIEKMQNFSSSDDPFEIFRLERLIKHVREWLPGMLCPRTGRPLPLPTHKSTDIPFERGPDILVVWLGIITKRNLRDMYEAHRARTGEELDPADVKEPELRESIIMRGEDEEDSLWVTVNRFAYPKWRSDVWDLKLDHDLLLVKGVKRGDQARRAIYVTDMWVIDPSEDEEAADDTEEELAFS